MGVGLMLYKDSLHSKEKENNEDEPPDIEKNEDESIEEIEGFFSGNKEDEKEEESEEFWEPFPEYNVKEFNETMEDKDYRSEFADVSLKNQKETRKKEEKLEEVLKKYKEREYKERVL